MKNSSIALGAAVISLFLAVPVLAAKAGCEHQLRATVPLHVSEEGAVLMQASLGGQEVYFHLRVGSGIPVLMEPAVARLGLTPKVRQGGADIRSGGQRITHYAMLEPMSLGDYVMLPRAAIIVPQEGPLRVVNGRPVVGVMGATIFRNVDAEIHLAAGHMKLFKPFTCRDRSPIYWGGTAAELPLRLDEAGTLLFTLELEGRRVEASMLTGMRDSTIDANVTRQFFGFDENSPGVEAQREAEGRSDALFHAMSLTGTGLQIRDARIRLLTGGGCKLTGSTPGYGAIGYATCVNSVPFRLGTDLLSQMRIYLSRERQKAYMTLLPAASAGQGGAVTVGSTP